MWMTASPPRTPMARCACTWAPPAPAARMPSSSTISTPSGGNPYIGSGELDGNGIPADFFSDVHVRKAFNYCFDYDAYIDDASGWRGRAEHRPDQPGSARLQPGWPVLQLRS